ncbi:hypothetical protein GTO89_02510 [Heliobacterium gestii]|uniref:PatG C-terminal domain-containing protein n=1 Tax=Heliomicrobium gestii TaxID=2699 RepID=A0A845LBL5_HELGE|nr:hypothetical protein [Heliomicrobium gestii]MBM7865655.1 hypothetical protein [Heliomicrobium gestii]MZP41905.1 hypothetical protein [Heliomicrobium gestii]
MNDQVTEKNLSAGVEEACPVSGGIMPEMEAAQPLMMPEVSPNLGKMPQTNHPYAGVAKQYIYAIGQIRPQFPTESVKREVTRLSSSLRGVTPDDNVLFSVLSQARNAALAREICWVLQIDGCVDSYILQARSPIELTEIIGYTEADYPKKRKHVLVIGVRGPVASPKMCNDLQLPILFCNQVTPFTEEDFVQYVSGKTKVDEKIVAATFSQLLAFTDNAGNTDVHRAINYVILKYDAVYKMAKAMLQDSNNPYTLAKVWGRPANAQGNRSIVEIIFTYEDRYLGDEAHWYCRVDVSDQFPFLVTPLARFYPGP